MTKFDNFVMGSMLLLISVALAAVAWMAVSEAKLPSFTLQKSQWTCTVSHTEHHGKMISTFCDQYNRITEN